MNQQRQQASVSSVREIKFERGELKHSWKVNGILTKEYVKCGKSNCRCSRGELHGGYYYLQWREGKKHKRRYIPREKAFIVVRQLKAGRSWMRKKKEVRDETRTKIELSKQIATKYDTLEAVSSLNFLMGVLDGKEKCVTPRNLGKYYALVKDNNTMFSAVSVAIWWLKRRG